MNAIKKFEDSKAILNNDVDVSNTTYTDSRIQHPLQVLAPYIDEDKKGKFNLLISEETSAEQRPSLSR